MHWPTLPPHASTPADAGDVGECLYAALGGLSGKGSSASFATPFVRDSPGRKSMYFSLDELQSCMDVSDPSRLCVDYTRTLMGFLLLQPAPRHIGMVGLGGGSLVRFCHRHLPAARMTVAEINPDVIALRREFQVPDDDARLRVLEADGASWVAGQRGAFDALLIDGFDLEGQPPALCSTAFYDDCAAALAPNGVLAVNLHHDAVDYPLWVSRLARSFNGNLAEILSLEKSNCVVLARHGEVISPRRLTLTGALAAVDGLNRGARAELKAEWARILWSMRDLAN